MSNPRQVNENTTTTTKKIDIFQGTARPIRATLVMSEKGSIGRTLEMDELEHLVYYCAFGHQVGKTEKSKKIDKKRKKKN